MLINTMTLEKDKWWVWLYIYIYIYIYITRREYRRVEVTTMFLQILENCFTRKFLSRCPINLRLQWNYLLRSSTNSVFTSIFSSTSGKLNYFYFILAICRNVKAKSNLRKNSNRFRRATSSEGMSLFRISNCYFPRKKTKGRNKFCFSMSWNKMVRFIIFVTSTSPSALAQPTITEMDFWNISLSYVPNSRKAKRGRVFGEKGSTILIARGTERHLLITTQNTR